MFRILCLLVALALLPTRGVLAAAKSINIAVLLSYDQTLPWCQSFMAGLTAAKNANGDNIEYYIEHLDKRRFYEPGNQGRFCKYLKEKYADITMDAAIIESDEAVWFMHKCGESIFGEIPYILISSDSGNDYKFKRFFLISNITYIQRTTALALAQNPKAKSLVVIGDVSGPGKIMADQVVMAAESAGQKIDIKKIHMLSIDALIKDVALLPPDAIVIFALVLKDNQGHTLVPKDVLRKVVAASPVPVYGLHDTFLGIGIVGGYLFSGKGSALQAVTKARNMIRQGEDEEGAFDIANAAPPVFDARAIKRWHIPAASLPPGSQILFAEQSFLNKYLYETLAALAFVLMETVILTIMIHLYIQRNKLAHNLQEANDVLEMRVEERTLELKVLACTDPLTGLCNRREFYQVAKSEMARFKRTQQAFAIVMIDLDRFKAVNDTYGHDAGDIVLSDFAALLKNTFRNTDIVARFGGEEFIAIMPETSLDEAQAVVVKICALLSEHEFLFASGEKLRISASFGIASSTEAPFNLDAIIKLADERLYNAKKRRTNSL